MESVFAPWLWVLRALAPNPRQQRTGTVALRSPDAGGLPLGSCVRLADLARR